MIVFLELVFSLLHRSDVWQMFHVFAQRFPDLESLKNYDDESSMPVIIDAYVEYLKLVNRASLLKEQENMQ